MLAILRHHYFINITDINKYVFKVTTGNKTSEIY